MNNFELKNLYGAPCENQDKPFVLLFFVQRQLFRDSFEYIEPLGLMALAAYIGDKGYEPGVFSGTATDAMQKFESESQKRRISAVGFYCDFENVSLVETFAAAIAEKTSIPVIIGGPQAAALNKDFFINSKILAAITGEGEEALFELLEFITRQKGSLKQIKGATFIGENGELTFTGEREPIQDLDSLPFQKQSYSLTGLKSNIAILSGRGCPFRCAFCYVGGTAKKVRLRSVKNVIAEIKQGFAENPEIKYIWFADDTFTISRERIEEFCDELSKLRRERNFVWFCEGHPGLLAKWPDVIKRMVDSGLVRMQIGIESGCASQIKFYRKQTDLTEIEKVVHACRDAGLVQLCGNIIIGGAYETNETLNETWSYIERLLDSAPGMLDISFTLFTPYPGAAITKSPQDFGIKIIDAESYTSTSDFPVSQTEKLSIYDISGAKYNFTKKLIARMRELLKEGKVPHELIMSHYRLNAQYGISSIWHRAVYSQNPFLDRTYKLLTVSSAEKFNSGTEFHTEERRPLRVFNMWNVVIWREMIPEIAGYVLSPLEYQVLLSCSGKLKIGEIFNRLYPMFIKFFENFEEFKNTVIETLCDFDRKNWIVFTKY
ncbi:MAG: radical SAM protein [Candidatus Wallbacteria bacterium]